MAGSNGAPAGAGADDAVPNEQELRALLRRDLDTRAASRPAGKRALRALCWVGLLLSIVLMAAAVWFHLHLDVIVRIPFVLFSAGGGLMLGVPCANYLVTGKSRTAGTPSSEPAATRRLTVVPALELFIIQPRSRRSG